MAGRLHAASPGRASHHRRPECSEALAQLPGQKTTVACEWHMHTRTRQSLAAAIRKSRMPAMREGIQEKGLMLTSLCSCVVDLPSSHEEPETEARMVLRSSCWHYRPGLLPQDQVQVRHREALPKPWAVGCSLNSPNCLGLQDSQDSPTWPIGACWLVT